jgi:hypothetical protein
MDGELIASYKFAYSEIAEVAATFRRRADFNLSKGRHAWGSDLIRLRLAEDACKLERTSQ